MELQNNELLQTEPTQQPHTESTPSPCLAPPRCQARNRNGSRCRLRPQNPGASLCRRHADRAGTFPAVLDDSQDLTDEIFSVDLPVIDTVEEINGILFNVIVLLPQGRISARRAAVITHGLSLMLRNVVVAERQALSQQPLDYDPPPLHEPLDHLPNNAAEAVAAYERLRT